MENKLVHIDEFKRVLQGYTISEQGKEILKVTKIALLIAPTSAGRNTIIRELLKTGNYHFIVSDTTRQPRINDGVLEQNGREYWFRSEEEVLEELKNGEFLEAEIVHNQQVSGISIRELKKAYESKMTAITDIDLLGIEHIVDAKSDSLPILVIPPSFEEWQRRIKQRGQMSPVEYRRRMETACKIFVNALERLYFKIVLNDDVSNASRQIQRLVDGRDDVGEQSNLRKLVQELLNRTKELLQNI